MRPQKLYRDKDWLHHKYWVENLSVRQVAHEANCGQGAVKYWMNKHGISCRSQKESLTLKPYCNEAWLRKRYLADGLDIEAIAKAFNRAPKTIVYWMERFNIPRRKRPQQKRYKISCTGCGKVMDLPEWEFRAGRKFCSPKCYGEWRSRNLYGERSSGWKGGKVERICEWCGCTFKFAASPSRTGRGRFCSRDCLQQWRSANLVGENSTNWKGGPVTLTCDHCGKEFTRGRSHLKKDKAQFCSRDCAYKSLHEQTRRAWAEGKYDFLKYTICNPSKLELGFAATLDKYGIVHKQQYQIQGDGRFFDFYIPDHNLLIEVDGEFWHHSDWAKKQGRPAKDRAKSTFATQQGYNLWRVRESEITDVGSPHLLKQIGLINTI